MMMAAATTTKEKMTMMMTIMMTMMMTIMMTMTMTMTMTMMTMMSVVYAMLMSFQASTRSLLCSTTTSKRRFKEWRPTLSHLLFTAALQMGVYSSCGRTKCLRLFTPTTTSLIKTIKHLVGTVISTSNSGCARTS